METGYSCNDLRSREEMRSHVGYLIKYVERDEYLYCEGHEPHKTIRVSNSEDETVPKINLRRKH